MTSPVVDGGQPCPGCGFVYDVEAPSLAAPAIEAGVEAMVELLRSHPSPLSRPAVDTWSVLEYAAHTRDVLLVQRERLLLALRSDGVPGVTTMGRDERVLHDGYVDQRVRDVAEELTVAARMIARLIRRITPADWRRELDYSYPGPARRSLAWVAVHTWHDVHHHRADVQAGSVESTLPR